MKKKLKVGQKGQLNELELWQKGCVLGIHNENKAIRQRLLDMGLTQGVIVQIAKVAPFGDPVTLQLRGYELCIRKQELKDIDIEVIS